jgi:hypothetical protein
MYAYILAANKSMPAEIIRLKRCFKEFKNILSAILTSPDGNATRQQKEQLEKLCSEFDKALRKAEGISEELSIVQEKSDKYQCPNFINILKGENLYDIWIKNNNLIPSYNIREIKQIITANKKEDAFESYMSDLNEKINLEHKKRQLNIQKEQIPTISSDKISSIPIEKVEKGIFLAKLLNEYLEEAWSGKDFMQSRCDFAKVGGNIFKEELKEKWEKSDSRSYINGLLKNLNEHTPFEIKNQESQNNQTLQSFAAFFQKGDDDIDKLEDYLVSNEIGDFRIAFALWGIIFGFADMPKTLTNDLFLYKDLNYIGDVYKYVYKQVHGVELEGKLEKIPVKNIPPKMNDSITESPKRTINQEPETKPSNSENQDIKNALSGCKLKSEQLEQIIATHEKHNGNITKKFFDAIKQIKGIGNVKIKEIKEALGFIDQSEQSKTIPFPPNEDTKREAKNIFASLGNSNFTQEQEQRLVANLEYVQNEHKSGENKELIKHFINLCKDKNGKFPKYRVPNFDLIEKEIKEILESKFPN